VVLLFSDPDPPRFTLFPYTTLFRSLGGPRRPGRRRRGVAGHGCHLPCAAAPWRHGPDLRRVRQYRTAVRLHELRPVVLRYGSERSEEHTSELQSRENLVCRLLLEKK